MADVDFVHQKVSVTDGRGFVFVCAAGDYHIFPDAVVVSDGHVCLLPFHIVKILWSSSDNGILIHNIIVAHDRTFEDACMGHNNAVVADDDILVDICKRFDLNVFAQFSAGVYIS